jgi:hypothetical protein
MAGAQSGKVPGGAPQKAQPTRVKINGATASQQLTKHCDFSLKSTTT